MKTNVHLRKEMDSRMAKHDKQLTEINIKIPQVYTHIQFYIVYKLITYGSL